MSRYKYELIEERMVLEDSVTPYMAYGIKHHEGTEKISDISCNREFVKGLVKKINRTNLPPYQLKDVVEDAIE